MSVFLGSVVQGSTARSIVQEGSDVFLSDLPLSPESARLWELRGDTIGTPPVTGEGVFDFRYGPFTGGVPESGIFHYATYGEKILSVAVDLSKKHRGIEDTMIGMDVRGASALASQLCGNFTVAHSLAFCQAVESIAHFEPSPRDRSARLIALELERVYNHLYVLWRLSSAAAQKIGSSFYGSFFERALRLTEGLSGRRGLRGYIIPGGVSIPPTQERIGDLAEQIERLRQDFERTHRRMLSSRNFLDRLHRTATVDGDRALAIGLTGPSLRATGTKWDLRSKEPLIEEFQPKGENEGDSFARMEVRAREFIESCAIIAGLYRRTSWTGGPSESLPEMSGEGLGAVESPSGTIAWVVGTENGRIRYAVVSPPSLFGFQAYAESVVGNIFTDVPFAYESFGVSFADAGR